MNRVMLIGNVGRDPELRYTPSGTAVCNFNIAVNDGKDKETGDPITTWWRATAWEKKAELAAEYLRKGSKVYIEGKPGYETYTPKDSDEVRVNLTVNVFQMEFLSSRRDEEDAPRQGRSLDGPPAQRRGQSNGRSSGFEDWDDLPF